MFIGEIAIPTLEELFINKIEQQILSGRLNPGDKLFVYTDGVPEAADAENNMFGTDRMIEALNVDPAGDPHQILENVQKAVDEFVQEAEQFDDLTMMCFAYKGKKALRKRCKANRRPKSLKARHRAQNRSYHQIPRRNLQPIAFVHFLK